MTRRGFSVIEALIAVAVLGLGLSALMALRVVVLRQMQTVATLETTETDVRNAMATLADINPMATPDGARELSPTQVVRWRSERITEVRRSKAYPAGDGDFDAALFRLHVAVVTQERTTAQYDVERLGWREADLAREE